MLVAKVWSFSDELQQSPYEIETDSQNLLMCSCPSFRIRRRTCKHITKLIEECRAGTIYRNTNYSITDYGKRFLQSYMKK